MTIFSSALFIFLPFIILTFFTSRTDLFFHIRSFVVLSGSMQPVFPVGSMVYAIPQTQYYKNDIITFRTKSGDNVTHRIIKINKQDGMTSFTTQGDANNTIDKIFVTGDQIIGKVVIFVPYMGLLANNLKTPIYFVALIIIPSIIFIALELLAIKNEIVKLTEKRILERLNKQV